MGAVGALHTGCSGPIHTKAPGCVGLRRLRPFSHARGPVAKTRVRLDCCLQCVPSPVLGSAADCWAADCVQVPRLSRGPQPHNGRGAHGALAHVENVPPGALAGALRDRPRTPRLLGCHPGRHGGALRSRVPLPVPWGILQLVPRRLVSYAHCCSAPLPLLLWLSALLPLTPALLVRVPLTSASSSPLLSPSCLLCSIPLPFPVPRPADVGGSLFPGLEFSSYTRFDPSPCTGRS